MKDRKSLVNITLIVLGMAALLFGLAKLATRGNVGNGNIITKNLSVPVSQTDQVKGPANAVVTLVEYSDYQCPACKTYEDILRRLSLEYDKELKLVYRNYPLTAIHQNAEKAAYAAEAAALQGKFWEMHDVLFNTQDKWSSEKDPQPMFVEYAKSLGLNEEQFKKDISSDAVKNKVVSDAKSGDSSGVQGTPTFFLNGVAIETPKNFEQFSAAIVEQIIIAQGNFDTTTSTK